MLDDLEPCCIRVGALRTVVGRRLVHGIFLQTNSPRRLSALFRALLVVRTSPWSYGRAGLTIDRQALHFEWIGGRIGSATSRISPDGTAADQEALSEFSQWLSKRSGCQDWRRSNSLAA